MSNGAGGLYGGNVVGNSSTMPSARSELDGIRMGVGRAPSAEYPDGYLGTIRSRRDDRLLDSVKNRTGQRSYQRGVHKGERIDPSDYYWPQGMSPDRGLTKRAQRTPILAEFAPPPHLVNDGRADQVADEPMAVDVRRQQQLSRLMPAWR